MHFTIARAIRLQSFADKTAFNFHEGVTAIVGRTVAENPMCSTPYGGRWASNPPKSLRGNEMADVIFNGADTRKPVGLPRFSLTFTDCAEELGIEWHDVRVTRRVYRDGNSEYLLNKNAVSPSRHSKSFRRHRNRLAPLTP